MIRLGPLTIYEHQCAMHGAWELKTPWGWLCWKRTSSWTWDDGEKITWRWYVYHSPDSTPDGCHFAFGPGMRNRGDGVTGGRREEQK